MEDGGSLIPREERTPSTPKLPQEEAGAEEETKLKDSSISVQGHTAG